MILVLCIVGSGGFGVLGFAGCFLVGVDLVLGLIWWFWGFGLSWFWGFGASVLWNPGLDGFLCGCII